MIELSDNQFAIIALVFTTLMGVLVILYVQTRGCFGTGYNKIIKEYNDSCKKLAIAKHRRRQAEQGNIIGALIGKPKRIGPPKEGAKR